jgi:hypothetical protein
MPIAARFAFAYRSVLYGHLPCATAARGLSAFELTAATPRGCLSIDRQQRPLDAEAQAASWRQNHSQRSSSEMQSKIACDYNDHDHYANNVKDIHCLAPVETTLGIGVRCREGARRLHFILAVVAIVMVVPSVGHIETSTVPMLMSLTDPNCDAADPRKSDGVSISTPQNLILTIGTGKRLSILHRLLS